MTDWKCKKGRPDTKLLVASKGTVSNQTGLYYRQDTKRILWWDLANSLGHVYQHSGKTRGTYASCAWRARNVILGLTQSTLLHFIRRRRVCGTEEFSSLMCDEKSMWWSKYGEERLTDRVPPLAEAAGVGTNALVYYWFVSLYSWICEFAPLILWSQCARSLRSLFH